MAVSIGGRRQWLLRAVESGGEVLNLLRQSNRDKRAALRPIRKLLEKQGFAPTIWANFYGAARRDLGLPAGHDPGLRQNTRAKNSHQPVRRRERKMRGFK